MINEIIGAISRALYEEFGESHEIYMEEISQDLKEPCFLINTLEPLSGRAVPEKELFLHPVFSRDRGKVC